MARSVATNDARAEARMLSALRTTNLHLVARMNVVARAPNPPLFAVWTLAFSPAEVAGAIRDLGLDPERMDPRQA